MSANAGIDVPQERKRNGPGVASERSSSERPLVVVAKLSTYAESVPQLGKEMSKCLVKDPKELFPAHRLLAAISAMRSFRWISDSSATSRLASL